MITVNGHNLRPTIFPDRTSQVWQLPEELLKADKFEITWQFDNEREYLHLAQLTFLMDHAPITLILPYLPYGRQDKQIDNTSTFALRTFAYLLNCLSFREVIIHDPHSTVALDLIKHSKAIYPVEQITNAIVKCQSDLICYPDKGALNKYAYSIPEMRTNFPYIWAEKTRDQLTGNITEYELFGNCEGKKVMIVDDICDGGMTFILLARKLLTSGAKEVNLFVSHGLFTKGTDILQEAGIHRFFTKLGERVDY